jgi:hypothetical protein
MKKLLLIAVAFTLCTCLSAQSLFINEFSCSNKSQLADNFNEYEDWVEIYNPSGSSIDISGYHLSDKVTDPTKWPIPAGTSIPAGGKKVFYCSDRNIVQGGQAHTNFKLTQTRQEYILIANPAGVIIDSVHITRYTQKNHSFARITDGAATWGVGVTPTPGATNANVKLYYAAQPTVSQSGGFYGAGFTLTITTTEPNSVIRYTTDGSEPTTASTQYTGPIAVNATIAIRARTFSTNANIPASFTETNTYIIGTTHTMPTVCLNGPFNSLFNSGNDIMHAIEYYGANSGSLIFKTEGDMKRHGNDSWAFDQKGMRFYTRDQYGISNNIESQLFTTTPRDEFDVIILKAAGSDNYPAHEGYQSAHIRDAFCQTLADKYNLNVDGRAYRPIVIYINGQYWGLYELRERVDADFTDYYYDQPQGKVDMLAFWGGLQLDEGSDTAWVSLYNYMMSNDLSIQSNYDYVEQRFDPLSLIDYFIINTYTVNSDWLNWNTAWWRGTKDAGVRWRYHLWDMDNTFDLGQNYTGLPTTGPDADPCAVEELFPGDPDIPHTGMFNKMLENDGFRQLYINRYADLINTAFDCTKMIIHLDSLAALLAPEMGKHTQRWGGNVATWNQNIQRIRDNINSRCSVIADGMVDCYDLTGPYNIVVKIDPPMQNNNVRVNTIIPSSYPYSGGFFGSNSITLQALPAIDSQFQYWSFNNNTPSPDNFSTNISVNLTTTDTIWAHFKKIFVQGIDEQGAKFGIDVYPSPTNNTLNINLSNNRSNKPLALNIFSATGQLVYSQQNVSFNAIGSSYVYTLNLASTNMKPGVYFVRLDDGSAPAVEKFVYQPE